jgi:protein-S-isoprenylcysteine O-methyltransferase Ste14
MTLGYMAGGLLVLVIMPGILYSLTLLIDLLFRITILPNDLIRGFLVGFLLVIGFAFGISSIVYQNVVGKGGPLEISDIEISPKTKHLVTSGPYKYSRNPMLFGTLLIYLAFALIINSLTTLLLILILFLFMLTVVVKMEEERLRKDFGDSYDQYCRRTSRFLPWKPKAL